MSQNSKNLIDRIVQYHSEELMKCKYPYVYTYDFLISAENLKVVGEEDSCQLSFLLEKPLKLPGLEYPVIKNISILEELDKEKFQKYLSSFGDKFFVIVESYNDKALTLLKEFKCEETYFHQEKLLYSLENHLTIEANQQFSQPDIVVRNFEIAKDEDKYIYLYNEVLGYLAGSKVNVHFIEEIEKRKSFDPRGYFIAEKNNEPVAFITIEKQPWGNDSKFGYIYQVGALPEVCGTGLTSFLIQKAFNFAKQKGIDRIGVGVRKSNIAAMKFFKKSGFKPKYNIKGYLLDV